MQYFSMFSFTGQCEMVDITHFNGFFKINGNLNRDDINIQDTQIMTGQVSFELVSCLQAVDS